MSHAILMQTSAHVAEEEQDSHEDQAKQEEHQEGDEKCDMGGAHARVSCARSETV